MEIVFKKKLERRLNKVHKIIQKTTLENSVIFDNLPMLFSVLNEKENRKNANVEFFPFTQAKKQKKISIFRRN